MAAWKGACRGRRGYEIVFTHINMHINTAYEGCVVFAMD
jgi:hypothetical protein